MFQDHNLGAKSRSECRNSRLAKSRESFRKEIFGIVFGETIISEVSGLL